MMAIANLTVWIGFKYIMYKLYAFIKFKIYLLVAFYNASLKIAKSENGANV